MIIEKKYDVTCVKILKNAHKYLKTFPILFFQKFYATNFFGKIGDRSLTVRGGVKRMWGVQIFEGKWEEVGRKLQVEQGGHINYIHTIYV